MDLVETGSGCNDDGVIHELVEDADLCGTSFHLELRCVPCNVVVRGGAMDASVGGGGRPAVLRRTRRWLTPELKARTIRLLSPVVVNHVLSKRSLDAGPDAGGGSSSAVKVIEDEAVRVAVTFRPDSWAAGRMRCVTFAPPDSPPRGPDDSKNEEDFVWSDENCEGSSATSPSSSPYRLKCGDSIGKGFRAAKALFPEKVVAAVAVSNPDKSGLERADLSRSLFSALGESGKAASNPANSVSKYFVPR